MESKKIDGNEETNTDFAKLFNGNLDGWEMIGNGSFIIIFEDGDDKKQQYPLLKGYELSLDSISLVSPCSLMVGFSSSTVVAVVSEDVVSNPEDEFTSC